MIKRRYIVSWRQGGKMQNKEYTNKRDRDRHAKALVAQNEVDFVETYMSTYKEGGSEFRTIKGIRPGHS